MMADSSKNKSKFECCTRSLGSKEVLTCVSCKKKYHFICVATSNMQYNELTNELKASWLCPSCNRPKQGVDNADTPIRTISNLNKHDSQLNITLRNKQKNSSVESEHLSLADVRRVIREEFEYLLEAFKTSIVAQFDGKLTILSDKLTEITDSVCFMEKQYEDMKSEVQQKIDMIKALESENEMLRININELNSRVSMIEQHSRANNIEIQCLPEHKSENLSSIVKQIAKTVNFNLNESDIHFCTRIAKVQKSSTRPRSILVKFSCSRVRDEFLAASIKFNKKASKNSDKLNTGHAGLGGDHKPIFILEHLSPTQKSLHAAARLKAKELNYQFVWVKRGHVYMRKNESSEYKFIRNMESLKKL